MYGDMGGWGSKVVGMRSGVGRFWVRFRSGFWVWVRIRVLRYWSILIQAANNLEILSRRGSTEFFAEITLSPFKTTFGKLINLEGRKRMGCELT